MDGKSLLYTACPAVKRTIQDEVARFAQRISFLFFLWRLSEMSHVLQSIYGRESRRGESNSMCSSVCWPEPEVLPIDTSILPECRAVSRARSFYPGAPGKSNFKKKCFFPSDIVPQVEHACTCVKDTPGRVLSTSHVCM